MARCSLRPLIHRLVVPGLVIACATPALPTCGGGGGGGRGGAVVGIGGPQQTEVYVVPWKLYAPGQVPQANGGFILHWFPASADESRKSRLQVSRLLSIYSGKCVAMAIVTPDNKPLVDKFAPDGKLSLAVLTDGAGVELGRVAASPKGLDAYDVEKLVTKQLDAKEDALKAQLKAAKIKAEGGDKEGAITDYKAVMDQKCLFPAKAKDAAKALQKLGVAVEISALMAAPDAIHTGTVAKQVERTMTRGLRAEERGEYTLAKHFYQEAQAMDPGDPVPLRFLGELCRHHTGEWEQSGTIFRAILDMPADPLSRAVALHGLGKMTIHAGKYEAGLAMFQQSIEAYPLALTYRNMAVYWNEWDHAKAEGFMRKALELDPKDPYNLIFAATYLADAGKKAEAMKIAKANEYLLSASYNLAAVYALLGEKDRALAMLHRHFYRYERFDAVRAKEMQEAKVDVVFASLKADPRFIALTARPRKAG